MSHYTQEAELSMQTPIPLNLSPRQTPQHPLPSANPVSCTVVPKELHLGGLSVHFCASAPCLSFCAIAGALSCNLLHSEEGDCGSGSYRIDRFLSDGPAASFRALERDTRIAESLVSFHADGGGEML